MPAQFTRRSSGARPTVASILTAVVVAAFPFAPSVARAQSTAEEARNEMAAAKAALPADAAKVLFGSAATPAPLAARSIGAFARGCLAGAVALPVDGAAWQVMRLSRNRNWGHPALIAYLERFSARAKAVGWNGLLVGDMSQPRGGPMLTGHASHQIGLDADIWFTPMPARTLSREERETISAVSMLKEGVRAVDPNRFGAVHVKLLHEAAADPEVSRIFVHPAIKKAVCEAAGPDRAWLSKIRPWYGHFYHFHVRLACPKGMPDCRDQEPAAKGDGCGADLAWWLGPEPWKPEPPSPPKPPIKLADLPPACSEVLVAK